MAKETAPVLAKPKLVSERKTKPNTKIMKLPSPLHPPYFQMISEAIFSLNDRTGSSQQAITKFIEEKYRTGLPPNFKKLLSIQLKKFAKSERLVKVKNSFKISPTEKVKLVGVQIIEKVKKTKKEDETKKIVEKVQKPVKTKRLSRVSTPGSKKVLTTKKVVKTNLGKVEKMKSLSQVKTPDCLKKVLTPKKRASKLKPAAKKARV